MANLIFQEALKYWSRGWNVIPLCPGSKKPLISWIKYQTQRNTKEELIEWFLKNPENNIGVVTGKISKLVVVDLDGPEGIKSGIDLSLISGCLALTPNGKHLYYSWTGETKNAVKIVDGIDIRGDGGYVVAPPSQLEANQSSYRWSVYRGDLSDYNPRCFDGIANSESTSIIEGNRNNALASIGGRLRYEGLDFPELYAKLIEENKRCQPPLEEEEVQTIAKSICRYEKGSKDLDSVSMTDLLKDAKPPKWIVDGLIPEESITIIGGIQGAGKSFMTLDLALELTRGGLWMEKYRTNKCGVLYIDEESSNSLLQMRLSKMLKGKGMEAQDIPVRFSVNKGIRFSNLLKLKTVRRLIELYKPKVVIVDSLVRVNDGDENFSTSMAAFFDPIMSLAHEYGIAFIFIDHEGKAVYQSENQNREPSSNDLRGSNAKAAAADAVFSLRITKEGLRFYHTKSRFGIASLPSTIRIDDEGEDKLYVRAY